MRCWEDDAKLTFAPIRTPSIDNQSEPAAEGRRGNVLVMVQHLQGAGMFKMFDVFVHLPGRVDPALLTPIGPRGGTGRIEIPGGRSILVFKFEAWGSALVLAE